MFYSKFQLMMSHLKRLYKGPEQDANGVALAQKFDKTGRSEEAQETQVDHLVL